jgi:hypothetical protein
MNSPIPRHAESQTSNGASNPNQNDVPSAQSQADLAEGEALARYLALRTLWSSCWGVRSREAPRRRRPQ